MKRHQVCFGLLFLLIVCSVGSVSALSIATIPSQPAVGEIVELGNQSVKVNYTARFEPDEVTENAEVSIAEYEKIVRDYVKRRFDDSIQRDLGMSTVNISVPAKLIEGERIKEEDLVVRGPHGWFNLGFTGLVSRNNISMVYASITESFYKAEFGSYDLNGVNLKPHPSDNISCKENLCEVEVSFEVGEDNLTLKPGQKTNPNSQTIKSIELEKAEILYPNDEYKIAQSPPSNTLSYSLYFESSEKASDLSKQKGLFSGLIELLTGLP